MNSAEDEQTPGQRDVARLAEDSAFRAQALASARRALVRHRLPTAAAEDVYQSAMLKLHKHFKKHNTEEIKDLRVYSMMVVLNEVRRLSERERRGPAIVYLEDMPEHIVASSAPGPLDYAVAVESASLLMEFMRDLKERERLMFELWLEGHTVRGIATVMHSRGVSVSHVTVAAHLKSIQKRLISFLG